jgi:hypothetical protein
MIYFGSVIRFCNVEKRSINAIKLSTTVGKILNISNTNIEFINKFLEEYIRSNGSSEYHQYNNLKVVKHLVKIYHLDIDKKEQILVFQY